MIGQVHTEKFFFFLGLTAGRSEGIAANRGFGPLENDNGVMGDAYVNPNSLAHAQGRTFTERGYTIKTAATYLFPHDTTFGIIGRYQDGQHFARLVIYDDLNQGPEAVRAFRNGRTRFTFEMTVDTRLQKGFTIGGRRADLIVDAYNLFNEYLEVEEITVSGPTSRLQVRQPARPGRYTYGHQGSVHDDVLKVSVAIDIDFNSRGIATTLTSVTFEGADRIAHLTSHTTTTIGRGSPSPAPADITVRARDDDDRRWRERRQRGSRRVVLHAEQQATIEATMGGPSTDQRTPNMRMHGTVTMISDLVK